MKSIPALTFVALLISCDTNSELTQQKEYFLVPTMVSGYYKTFKYGNTTDSVSITNIDSMFQKVTKWATIDTIKIKNDTLFKKISNSNRLNRYYGYTYKEINDSIQLTEIGFFDSLFTLDSLTSYTSKIILRGSAKCLYNEVSYWYLRFGNWSETWYVPSVSFSKNFIPTEIISADSANCYVYRIKYQ